MANNKKNEGKCEVFISERTNANHAEDILIKELSQGKFKFPTNEKEFYVSSTPCYKCTQKIIDHFWNWKTFPTIYVSRLFYPDEVKNINAVMRLLLRGYEIYTYTPTIHLKLVDEICYNKKKKIPWRKQLCKEAKNFIMSGAGNLRYQYTKGVLEHLREEASILLYEHGDEIYYKDSEKTNYIGPESSNKIWKIINKYREQTCVNEEDM